MVIPKIAGKVFSLYAGIFFHYLKFFFFQVLNAIIPQIYPTTDMPKTRAKKSVTKYIISEIINGFILNSFTTFSAFIHKATSKGIATISWVMGGALLVFIASFHFTVLGVNNIILGLHNRNVLVYPLLSRMLNSNSYSFF